jgi:hypothetical protein
MNFFEENIAQLGRKENQPELNHEHHHLVRHGHFPAGRGHRRCRQDANKDRQDKRLQ